eukprot:9318991-Pyramimonas_sp.AAC.1
MPFELRRALLRSGEDDLTHTKHVFFFLSSFFREEKPATHIWWVGYLLDERAKHPVQKGERVGDAALALQVGHAADHVVHRLGNVNRRSAAQTPHAPFNKTVDAPFNLTVDKSGRT